MAIRLLWCMQIHYAYYKHIPYYVFIYVHNTYIVMHIHASVHIYI